MTRALWACLFAATLCLGQAPTKAELVRRADELQTVIASEDWAKAAELSSALRADVTAARNRTLSSGATTFVASFLTWLPTDTETLIVAQEPFPLITDRREEMPAALDMARGFVTGLLDSAEKQALAKALQGQTITSAAVAARNFHSHQGPSLGLIAFEGCGVYNLADPMPASALSRPPEDSVLGYRVWTSEGKMSESKDTDTFFVALLEPRMLAVCNNRNFLQEMITRKGQPQPTSAYPTQWEEWRLVDRTALLWGVSHYAQNASMIRWSFLADGLTGIAFAYGPSGNIKARVNAKSNPWAEMDEDYRRFMTSGQAGDNAWELDIAAGSEAGMIGTLLVMGAAGFAVII